MSGGAWLLFFLFLIGGPLASIIWFCMSWSKFKGSIPFTPEYKKRKGMLIVSAVVTGVIVAIYLVIMAIYGATVFFA